METQSSVSHRIAPSLLIGAVSVFLGLCFNYFFYDKAPGISFPLYVGFILAGLFIIASKARARLSPHIFWLAAPLIFFSAMVAARTSAFLTVLNIGASLLLLLLVAKLSLAGNIKKEFHFILPGLLLLVLSCI